MDPCLHLDGLPNPFSVYFPASISNLYGSTIYITALLVSPPAGWTDTEQNIGTLAVGASGRFEKSNATRATGVEGTNETITVRWRYRITSYSGTIIGFDDFDITIYWELISAGTVDDTSDEWTEVTGPPRTLDGWTVTEHCVNDHITRDNLYYVHGAWSARFSYSAAGHYDYLTKAITIGAGDRAGIFGFHRASLAGNTLQTVTTPVETLQWCCAIATTWRRWGFRLTPGTANTVVIRSEYAWGGNPYDYFDYVRAVHW